MNPWQDRHSGDPLSVKECLRVLLSIFAVALLGVWTRLEIPEAVYDAEPADFLRVTRLADPALSEGVPAFARSPLPELSGQAMVEGGGLGALTAHTLVAVLGGFLGGLALWGFLRFLCGKPLPALAACVIVLMQPWRTTLATDPAVAWLLGPSLALAGVAWICRGGGVRASLLAGAGYALCGWTSFAQLPVCLLGGLILIGAHIPLMRRPFPSGEPVAPKGVLLASAGALAVAVVLLLPAFWSGLPAASSADGSAASGWLGADGAIQMLGVQLSPEGHHFYWPVMIGWLVFGLLVWMAMNVRDPRLRPWWYVLLAAFLLLQGSRLHLFGHEVERAVMPHAWFSSLPGFSSMHGPAEWLPLFGVALAAVLALGLREWQVQHGRAATFLLAAFTALELRPEPVEPTTLTAPALYTQMAHADSGAVLELPLHPSNAAALWQAASSHHRPVALAQLIAGAPLNDPRLPDGLAEFLQPTAEDPAAEPESLLSAQQALDAQRPETLAAWRRWLEDVAEVRWIVMRHAPDTGVHSIVRQRATWLQKFKREITPWSFNRSLHEERDGSRRRLAQELRACTERSMRARVLIEHWYGAPDARQGSAYATAWNLRLTERSRPVEAGARRDADSSVLPAAAPR